MSELAIGIDLGTSNSAVAVVRNGKAEVLTNAFGEKIIASVVAFGDDGVIRVGNEAKAHVIRDPEHTVYSSKRLIGRYFFSEEVTKAQGIYPYQIVEGPDHSVRIQIREEVFSLPELAAMVLGELKQIAETQLGEEVSKAVITVPAYFNDNQRQATKDAGRIAGLEVLRILNEPTAAALAYGFGKGLTQRVAVYDLGGGTFDISILEIGDDVFEVIATSGDTFLGGDDFDERIMNVLADEVESKEGVDLRKDAMTLELLKVAAESAKKELSTEDRTWISIPDVIPGPEGTTQSIERELTAEEFGSLVGDLVQRTFKVCDEALQQAGALARELDGVVLVGGPTRLPLIRDAVQEYFQAEPKTDVDPDVVVAMGAAIHAAEIQAPEQKAVLLDVTPLSLRVGVVGGLAETIIARNTPVPIEQGRSFTTAQDDQSSVRIRVYQGEARRAEENEMLGEFEFSGFPVRPRGDVEIQVSFAINNDGIVDVTAREPETGEQASTRISLSSGLSAQELESIMSEGRIQRLAAPPVTPDVEADTELQAILDAAEPAAEPEPEPEPEVELAPASEQIVAPQEAPEDGIDLGVDDELDAPELSPDDLVRDEVVAAETSTPNLGDGIDLGVEAPDFSPEDLTSGDVKPNLDSAELPEELEPLEELSAPSIEAPAQEAVDLGLEEEIDLGLDEEVDIGVEEPVDVASQEPASLDADDGVDLGIDEDVDLGIDEEVDLSVDGLEDLPELGEAEVSGDEPQAPSADASAKPSAASFEEVDAFDLGLDFDDVQDGESLEQGPEASGLFGEAGADLGEDDDEGSEPG